VRKTDHARRSPEEKLALLRRGDPLRHWESLDDKRQCVLCECTFSGHQVRVVVGRGGHLALHCPSEDCNSTPHEWIRPGNPLLDDKVWEDWVEILNELSETPLRAASSAGRRVHYAD
jgi:hypothetical protein